MKNKPPLHIECGRRHWDDACPQERLLKDRIWQKILKRLGWKEE